MTAAAASYGGTSWRERSACRNRDPEIFFPIGKTGMAGADLQRAKAICGTCPVRPQCLAFALDSRQDYGVWGGHDEDERRILLRKRHRQSRLSNRSG
ncbi:MAG: WhiB family transcriptional regulator [Streptosporangiaceae bacterium]